MLKEATKEVGRIFGTITALPCRAAIKWLEEPPSSPIELDAWPVRDLVRSHARRSTGTTGGDFVGNNSHFRTIIEGRQEFFLSNDLPEMFLRGEYANSHWTYDDVRDNRIDYRAAIVAPIGRFLEDRTMATALGFEAVGQDLVGFLCLDAKERNAFEEERDINLALALAHGLFPVLHLYRQVAFTYLTEQD